MVDNRYKCNIEMHARCNNSSLCHLCDGKRLYKNEAEDAQRKLEQRMERQKLEKNAIFRTHKSEKKEGMAFEKMVQKKWNDAYKKSSSDNIIFKQSTKKTKIQKPRLIEDEPLLEKEKEPMGNTPSPSYYRPVKKKPPAPQKIYDAKRQVNSGATWHSKGDIITADYLMECKERGTINARGEKTISIPKEWLLKQEREAIQENRPYWLLPFHYKGDDTIYVIKPFDQEIDMYHEIRRLKEKLRDYEANK